MPDPNGKGLAKAIKAALDMAGYKPQDIGQ